MKKKLLFLLLALLLVSTLCAMAYAKEQASEPEAAEETSVVFAPLPENLKEEIPNPYGGVTRSTLLRAIPFTQPVEGKPDAMQFFDDVIEPGDGVVLINGEEAGESDWNGNVWLSLVNGEVYDSGTYVGAKLSRVIDGELEMPEGCEVGYDADDVEQIMIPVELIRERFETLGIPTGLLPKKGLVGHRELVKEIMAEIKL